MHLDLIVCAFLPSLLGLERIEFSQSIAAERTIDLPVVAHPSIIERVDHLEKLELTICAMLRLKVEMDELGRKGRWTAGFEMYKAATL